MMRRQWIVYLFSIAFAMSLAHTIFPHNHPKEKGKHHQQTSSSHHHHGDHHEHSHEGKPMPTLPVFIHFSNGDFIPSVKYSFEGKQRQVLEFEQPIIVSIALPALVYLPSPVPHARDLPRWVLLSIQSLRAPPSFLS